MFCVFVYLTEVAFASCPWMKEYVKNNNIAFLSRIFDMSAKTIAYIKPKNYEETPKRTKYNTFYND